MSPLMAVVLGLLVALSYGSADFFGGLSTKRSTVASVVVWSQAIALPAIVVVAMFSGGEPTGRGLGLGAASGVVGGIGLTLLYRGLGRGRMSVVAPITAVGAAIVPVVWGVVRGERPSIAASTGVVLALVAVVLISRSAAGEDPGSDSTDSPAASVVLAVTAGIAFGVVFVLLAETGRGVGFWPLVAGRVTSVTLLSAGALAGRQRLRLRAPGEMATIAAAGLLDITANGIYLLAAREGLLSLVAVLSSLYPASTVLLARVVLRERLTRLQILGLTIATAGVVLIAAG